MLLSTSSSLGHRPQLRIQHELPELPELELLDPREHPLGHRRVELGHRQQHVEQPDRRLHDAGREPRRTRHAVPVRRHPGRHRRPTYTSFGSEPFTPNNELRYNTFQLQDNFTKFGDEALADLRRQRREVPLRERLLPGQAERLRLQLAGRLLHRRQRLPGEPEPDDVAGHPAPVPGALQRTSRAWRSRSSRSTCWYTGVYAQDEWRPKSNLTITAGMRVDVAELRRTPAYDNPNADALTFRDEDGDAGPVQHRQAAGRDAAVVAARRLQLGRERRPDDAGARRHGRLHRQAGLRLDLEPDRQHRRADRASIQVDNTTALPVQPEPRHVQADQRHRRTGGERTTSRVTDPDFKFPQMWRSNIARRPQAAVGARSAPVEFIYNRDVNGMLLHQRQPAGGAVGVRRRRQPAAVGGRVVLRRGGRSAAASPASTTRRATRSPTLSC